MATETHDEPEVFAEDEFPDGALVFRTLIHSGSWTSSDGETYNDLNVIEDPSATLIRDVSHAHAAGVVEVVQGLDLTGVQSQEDGEAEYEKAVEEGRWQEGQAIQAALEAEARERGDATVVVEVTEEEGS